MRLPALLLALLAVGCSGAPVQLAHPAAQKATMLKGGGEFTAFGPDAVTYDRRLVPAGAQASLTTESTPGQTITSLVVEGFLPRRAYGAHLHTKPCGRKGDDAGPHYQHMTGQVNPASEVWLDLTTDDSGAGHATARHAWHLDAAGAPRSLVVHARHTTTTGPDAGTAGDRIACLTLS
ncbi:superoxide dismutase family protein [Nonomuraea sp. LPB2021202275-12-8]|uniref:superoxide dismutase family protein n=1 Tax=Nonomuraea sp. LPB2021202275-12-8 TaxID=3120159 RepID=UPI00300CCB65